MTTYEWLQLKELRQIQNSKKPQNTHLIWQDNTYGIYFVDSTNNKVLLKTIDEGVTVFTVTTRSNKNIARGWHDETNHIIYLVDCEYDDTFSYIYKIDLSDDSITEIESVPADVFDIWRYNNETYISYFGSAGHALESETITPNADIITEWYAVGDHYVEIDEAVPNDGDYISVIRAVTKKDEFGFTNDDDGGWDLDLYDSGEIYEIEIKGRVYSYYATSNCEVKGNKTGTTGYKDFNHLGSFGYVSAVYSGLSLNKADLDGFQVELKYTGTDYDDVTLCSWLQVTVRFYGNEQIYLNIKKIDGDTWPNNMGVIGERTWNMSQMTIVGTDFHFNWQWSDENVLHYRFQTGDNSFDELIDCGANTEIPSIQQWAIAYDGVLVLYFVLKDTSDSKYYLYTWDGTTLTKLEEYNVALMLDRNTHGDAGSPYEYEKAFHVSLSYVFQISKMKEYLHKLQDLGLTSGETIIAISDKYLITSNSDLYKLTDYFNKLSLCKGIYQINKLPRLELRHKSPLSTDTIIEIYEDDETKCFSGRLGTPKYSNRHKDYSFKLENFGRDDLTREIDDTATAEDIATTVINQINDNSKYLYTDATATPSLSVNNTNIWDDLKLKDNLYTLRILGNAFTVFEANGYVYFRKWSNKVVQPQHYFNKPDYFKKETGKTGTNIKWVDNAILYNGACEIIAKWQNHKNILRFTDDITPGENPLIIHNITQATSGTVEYYIGTNNISKVWRIWLHEAAVGVIIYLSIHSNNLYYFDSGSVFQVIQAVAKNTLYHLKVIWRADNTFDVWVDKVLKVDNVACTNDQTSGVHTFRLRADGDSTDFLYFDAPGNIADDEYSEGDNLKGAFHKTGDVGAPSPKRVQEQYNTWSIRGGWDTANTKPFEKEETDAEHIQQYGPLKWRGKDLFTEARTQASLDAIATGLNNWRGMQDNPDDVIIDLYGYEFVGVGKSFVFTWDYILGDTVLLQTTTTYIIAKNRINFKTGKQRLTLSTNIVSRGAAI